MAYRRIQATSDCYITDKIIRELRHKSANTGRAGTLDLFKLYDVSVSGSVQNVIELSRLLIKFDINELRALTGSVLDTTRSSFKAYIKLFDVHGGQTVPSNFTLVAHALSRSFDEGIGRDVVYFNDIDSANFLTSSFSTDPVLWYAEGADKGGLLGSDDIDIITSGNLSDGNGVIDLSTKQTFGDGTEDFYVDVTTIISATLANQIPDHGFRIAFTSSQETDQHTYFVKRFVSRHANDRTKRPRLIVKYDDTIQDHQNEFYFDMSGSMFLYNNDRNGLANIVSGSTEIAGLNSLSLRLMFSGSTGMTSSTFNASQHKVGSLFMTGTYSSSFCLSSTDSTYKQHLMTSGSIDFYPIWESLDTTVGYHTGSIITVKRSPRSDWHFMPRTLSITFPNLKRSYRSTDRARIRVFAFDHTTPVEAVRLPKERRSNVVTNMHYSIRDAQTDVVIVPFDTTHNSTLLSVDSQGMYFDLFMSDFDIGRSYKIAIMINDNQGINDMRTTSVAFTVDP